MEEPCWSRLQEEVQAIERSPHRAGFLAGRETSGNHSRTVCEELQFIRRTHTAEVLKRQKFIGDTPHSSRARVQGRRSSKNEES